MGKSFVWNVVFKLVWFYLCRFLVLDKFLVFSVLGCVGVFGVGCLFFVSSVESVTVFLVQLSCLFVFVFSFLGSLGVSKVLGLVFSSPVLGGLPKGFVVERKLFFSVFLLFFRVLFGVFLGLGLLWSCCYVFFPLVFSRVDLVFVFSVCVWSGVFWFMFGVVLRVVVSARFVLPVFQVLSLLFVFGGGWVLPASGFSSAVSVLTQVLPSRAVGDVLLYGFLGSRVPGGALVSFGEWFFVCLCFFVLAFGWCRVNRKDLFD